MIQLDQIVKLRLTANEKAVWQALAAAEKMTLADFIRNKVGCVTVGRQPKKRRLARRVDPVLIASIARIGSNLNQLARWANSYKGAASASQVITVLIEIDRQFVSFLPRSSIAPHSFSEVKNVG